MMGDYHGYLVKERPLLLIPTLAKMLGVHKALIIQQLFWLLEQKNFGQVIDGHKYIYNSYPQWIEEYFPFWSVAALRKQMLELEKDGYIITIQPKKDKYNHTKFYRLNMPALKARYEEIIAEKAEEADETR